MACYITRTGSFLPGEPVSNSEIETYLGQIEGEEEIKQLILAANKIKTRHYAQDSHQKASHDVYELAVEAVDNCLKGKQNTSSISYLSAGSTSPPLIGPGLASVLHGKLAEKGLLDHAIEINSSAGICTSAAQSIVNAYRAIEFDRHESALCVASEHPSEVLKSSFIKPEYDKEQIQKDVRKSKWFMSVFLRFMLSDGAGAFLMSSEADPKSLNFKIDWTYSESFAHEAPLCMKLERQTMALSQDPSILARHLGPTVKQILGNALSLNKEALESYDCILPHLSSYYFFRSFKRAIRDHLEDPESINWWTNLDRKGNTGSASIFIMLDEFARKGMSKSGDRLILFIPESGQFNFVIISLTVV